MNQELKYDYDGDDYLERLTIYMPPCPRCSRPFNVGCVDAEDSYNDMIVVCECGSITGFDRAKYTNIVMLITGSAELDYAIEMPKCENCDDQHWVLLSHTDNELLVEASCGCSSGTVILRRQDATTTT